MMDRGKHQSVILPNDNSRGRNNYGTLEATMHPPLNQTMEMRGNFEDHWNFPTDKVITSQNATPKQHI